MGRFGSKMAFAAMGVMALAGCASAPGEGGASFGQMFVFAGSSVPPAQQVAGDDVYCPTVGVVEGGAALQAYSGGRVGEASALRSQITLGQLARECHGQPDGSTIVKVGVEGRALLGAGGGAAGRYDVPVRIIVKDGSTILADRTRRTAVSIPAGQTQASFVMVEEGILVPPSAAQSFEIEVGLGAGAQGASGRKRRG